MEKSEQDKISAFDSLYTTNQIQLFKVMIPYMAPSMQKNLVIYIKYMEFQYTMTLFQKHPYAAFTPFSSNDKPDSTQLFDEIIPFCDMTQREKIQQIKNMIQNMEQMKEMMGMMEMMKDMFPEGLGGMGGLGGGIMPDLSALSGLGDIMNLFASMQAASGPSSNEEA